MVFFEPESYLVCHLLCRSSWHLNHLLVGGWEVTLFEIEFLFGIMYSRLGNSLGFSCLLPSNWGSAEIIDACYHIPFYMNARD